MKYEITASNSQGMRCSMAVASTSGFLCTKCCRKLATKICGKLKPTVQSTGMSPTATLLPPIFFTKTGSTVCSKTKLMAIANKPPSQTFATKFHLTKRCSGCGDFMGRSSTIDFDLLGFQCLQKGLLGRARVGNQKKRRQNKIQIFGQTFVQTMKENLLQVPRTKP